MENYSLVSKVFSHATTVELAKLANEMNEIKRKSVWQGFSFKQYTRLVAVVLIVHGHFIFLSSRTTEHAYHVLAFLLKNNNTVFAIWHKLGVCARKLCTIQMYSKWPLSPESAKISMSASSLLIWQCDVVQCIRKLCTLICAAFWNVQREAATKFGMYIARESKMTGTPQPV